MGLTRDKKLAIAIVTSTLLFAALFLAQGATRLVAAALFAPGEETAGVRLTANAPVTVAQRSKDVTPILQRNIFDSQSGDLTIVPEPETEEEDAVEDVPVDPNAPAPRCDGSMRLVGAFVNERSPESSVASIAGASGTTQVYRRGMEIDGRELVEVTRNRVLLRPTSGSVCQLQMFAVAEDTTAPVRSPVRVAPAEDEGERPAPPEREGAISAADMDNGITRVSDTEYNIQRSLLDKVLENQAEMMRAARVIPQTEGGRTVGVKLYGIRRNALLGRVGLQNGDMLRTINGFDMSSPDSALEAYARLRSAEHLTVSVVRGGQPVNLTLNIR